MRIAVFDNVPDGGAKRVAFEQVKHLSKDHEVMYATGCPDSFFPFREYASKVLEYELVYADHHGLFRPLKDGSLLTQVLPAYQQVARDLEAEQVDCVIAHPCRLTQAPMLLMHTTLPTIYMFQEWPRILYEPEHYEPIQPGIKGSYEKLRRFMLRHIDWVSTRSATHIATSSHHNANNLESAYGKQASIIPPGVDIRVFKPAGDGKRNHFLFIGEKEAINGYDLLQEALSFVDWPINIQYVSFSQGSFRYTEAELVTMYQEAVATLCLGRDEPFGLASIESQACGTPIIGLNEGGYMDTVIDGETGWLIRPEPKALIEAIRQAATKQSVREAMGKKARGHVHEAFTWNQHMQKLVQIIEEVVA